MMQNIHLLKNYLLCVREDNYFCLSMGRDTTVTSKWEVRVLTLVLCRLGPSCDDGLFSSLTSKPTSTLTVKTTYRNHMIASVTEAKTVHNGNRPENRTTVADLSYGTSRCNS